MLSTVYKEEAGCRGAVMGYREYLFPGAWGVGFACCIHSWLEEVHLDQSGGQLAPVGDVLEDDAGSFEQAFLVTPVSHALEVGLMGSRDELLQWPILLGDGIRIHQLCVYLKMHPRSVRRCMCTFEARGKCRNPGVFRTHSPFQATSSLKPE